VWEAAVSLIKKILIGVVIYLVFLVVYLPAGVALRLAPLPTNLSLGGVQGSLWSGSVETLTMAGRQVEQLRWDLNPWPLLLGRVELDLQLGSRAAAVSGKGKLGWSASGLSIEGLRFEAPNPFLIGNARLPFRTEVGGELSLLVDNLVQGTPWCESLKGKLFLNRTQVKNQFGDYPLGDMELALACSDGKVQLKADESRNHLGVSGTIELAANKLVMINAKIKETQQQSADLKQSLKFLGQPDADGYYQIKYQGQIPGI
jgi:general secretion pathway protein N